MKSWQPISNGGKFYVQFNLGYIMHLDRRGRPIRYRSIENARKAADKLNQEMRRAALLLTQHAHNTGRAVDHLNGIVTDNRPENLRIVTRTANL